MLCIFICLGINPLTKRFLTSSLQKAVEAILRLPQSEARDALVRLTHAVITRKK
jgi:geranylgeranyl pyrophosphate synthase